MANKKDLANGFVANNITTSSTTLALQTGYGQTMPTPPFYLTLTPPGQLSTVANSEIVLVTNVASDILTVTRAQKGTTAKEIKAGWIASNSIYAEDVDSKLLNPLLVVARNTATLSGAWNTTKAAWTLGAWTQFGRMAKTNNPSVIKIDNPNDYSLYVKLSHQTGSAHPVSSGYTVSGIGQMLSDGTTFSKFLTSSLTANGDLFISQSSATVVEIPPHEINYFAVWISTSNAGTNVWQGGGASTSTAPMTWQFGSSCVLTAELVGDSR